MAAFILRDHIPEEGDSVVDSEREEYSTGKNRQDSLESHFPELDPFDEGSMRIK